MEMGRAKWFRGKEWEEEGGMGEQNQPVQGNFVLDVQRAGVEEATATA